MKKLVQRKDTPIYIDETVYTDFKEVKESEFIIFLKGLLCYVMLLFSIFILSAAMFYPWCFKDDSFDAAWLGWIIYPLALVCIAGSKQIHGYCDKHMPK